MLYSNNVHCTARLQPDETMLYSNNVHCTARRTMKTEVTHLQVLHETLCGVDDWAERVRTIAAAAGVPQSHHVAQGAARQ